MQPLQILPSNVFANTGTNVSVLFFDKAKIADRVILIDASKLGEEYKDSNGLKNADSQMKKLTKL